MGADLPLPLPLPLGSKRFNNFDNIVTTCWPLAMGFQSQFNNFNLSELTNPIIEAFHAGASPSVA